MLHLEVNVTMPEFDPETLEQNIRQTLQSALANAPFIREEIPWEETDEGQPLTLGATGPLHVQGEDTSTAHVRGLGTARRKQPRSFQINGPAQVRVPRAAHLILESVSGPAHVGGLTHGEVQIGTINGPIKVSATQTCLGHRINGPADFKDITARIEIDHIRGPVLITPCPPLVQLKDVRGPVRINCPDPAGKRIVVHSNRSVVIEVPPHTEVQGVIRSTAQVQVDLDQVTSRQDAEVRLTAEHPERALTVEITAGKQVYIGPNPPEISESAIGWELLEKFLNLWRGRSSKAEKAATALAASAPQPQAEAPSASAPDPEEELRQARQRILRLLAEGKITLEEAERLLDALEA